MNVYELTPVFESIGYDHLPLRNHTGAMSDNFYFAKTYLRGRKNVTVTVFEDGAICTEVYDAYGTELDYDMPKFHKDTIDSVSDLYAFDSFMQDAVLNCEIRGWADGRDHSYHSYSFSNGNTLEWRDFL